MQVFRGLCVCCTLLAFVACGSPSASTTTEATTVLAPNSASTEAAVATEMPEPAATATLAPETTAAIPATPTLAAVAVETITANPATLVMETATMAADTATTTATGATGMLTVFAAASLNEAFGEIGIAFEAAHPGTKLTFNFAGSQQLAQQITQGAPADVFASANASQMNVVIDGGQVVTGTQTIFVRNRLVIIYPIDNPAQITTIMDLAKPGLKLDLAAKEVPVGQYSLDFLDKAAQEAAYGPQYKDAVIGNIVSYEENVRAVLAKVTLGEVDAGIVYTSDVSQDAADKVGRLDIPDELNTIAKYPIAPIKDSANSALAEQFIAYVRGEAGQAVLLKYGFLAP